MGNTDSPSAASPTENRRDLRALEFRVEPFTADRLPLVAAFSERYWTRPRTPAFYRWRYVDSQPFGRMFLALTADECLGMVFGLRKPYRIFGQPLSCLEVFDWHSLPGLKGSGVGIRVMRAMMREPDRLIAMGGTADVLSTLPAMKWQLLATAQTFTLPMSGDFLARGLHGRLGVRIPGAASALGVAAATWFRPQRRAVQGEVMTAATFEELDIEPLYSGETGYDLLQVPEPAILKWMMSRDAGAGTFQFLKFIVGGELRGWALTRVYETEEGREASILEIFAPSPDHALYTWMISEAASSLTGAKARVIRARATCPILQSAFLANRFRRDELIPIHSWPATVPQNLRVHITLNHSDAPLRPYPVAVLASNV